MNNILPYETDPPIFGFRFSPARMKSIVEFIVANPVPLDGGVRCVVTANLDHICRLRVSPAFRHAYSDAWLRTIDGMPVLAYARLRGSTVPCRITGADLFAQLFDLLNPATDRPFFVTACDEVGLALVSELRSRGFSEMSVAYITPPYGFSDIAAEDERLAYIIRMHRCTHLFFGVGSPKSELWIHSHRNELGDLYAFCVGAALEFKTGMKKRAPSWMRRTGTEWLWRLGQEPRRLARRYLLHSWYFWAAVRDDIWNRGA
ncbi:WecB/TagA/CpsF family glycosyltransferase [Ancylobacter sp. MQZ15Z-1]|uniref:WecB/TagA/CpsF family glycosyltransferase n=1 Tax=Ancylobacter mangrovi TaxID=2972472 RepID=A0A9X2PIL3_9HYPH|nr:WecB/TagA/CpsF family glycosyltransferase [Ancylobacter mangrovi]MCS0496878.1 WecB/TagA/CpsF family glycosyltransferase [Ancylobacter mangrovi]